MPSPYGGIGANHTAYHGSDSIVTETGPAQPLDSIISASASGANAVIAAVGNRKIRVLEYLVIASAGVNVTWESSGGTVKSGALALAQNGGCFAGFSPVGHFDTLAGEGLTLFLGSAVQVSGHLKYILV